MNKKWSWLATAAMGLSLVACQSVPNTPNLWQSPTTERTVFESSGRLAVKQNDKGSYAHFDWASNGQIQQLNVNTPLGNTVGQLCVDNEGVVAQSADGKLFTAASAAQLSEQLMGFAIPLDALDVWAHGHWHEKSAHAVLADGRLQQDGWLIERQINADGQPRLLFLENHQLSIRLIFSDYQAENAALNVSQCER